MEHENHYTYLEKHLPAFWQAIGLKERWFTPSSILSAHGDKAYGYRSKWEKAGIPFNHGVALYLLTYIKPYSEEVRETRDCGWVDVGEWVISNYDRFKQFLPKV